MLQLYKMYKIDCLKGLKKLPDNYIQRCVINPPYWRLRNYRVKGQLGLEDMPDLYVGALVKIFNEVRWVLKPDGTLWLNLGDCYWGAGKAGKNPDYQRKHKVFGKTTDYITKYGKPVNGKYRGIKPKDLIGLPGRWH